MSKRSADRQITKDDPTEEEGAAEGEEQQMEEGGTWRQASTAQLAGRVIVKARRKGISAPTGVAMPAFNFGATMPTTAATPPAAAAAAPAAASEAAPLNALQKLAAAQAASSWACPTCDTNNKLSDSVCGACEQPNPNAPASSPSAAAAAAPAPVSAFTFGSAPAAAAAATPVAATEAPVENALTRLAAKQAAESWECGTCMTNNKMTAATCGACEEPRPAGLGNGAAATATEAAPAAAFTAPVAFSFGAPAASSAATAAAPATFSFGAGEASATAATFGSVPSFSFGGSLGGAAPVSFGSVASGAAATFGAAAAVSAPQFEISSAEALQSANSELNTQFLNKSKESTGEENDQVHLKVLTKVFQIKKVPIVKIAPELQHGPTGEVTAAAAGCRRHQRRAGAHRDEVCGDRIRRAACQLRRGSGHWKDQSQNGTKQHAACTARGSASLIAAAAPYRFMLLLMLTFSSPCAVRVVAFVRFCVRRRPSAVCSTRLCSPVWSTRCRTTSMCASIRWTWKETWRHSCSE